ncbi:hypothetical protein PCNPT3_08270 [Psychromonas sp. CNPT3]|uniref:HD domain-containing protein n=1 Tax=Psychromonas sp. CNPT3 TaxID=314282 RepID=UPI0002C10F23|nr:HD domain-containing protein [Psychromonas sp. CNPT3]AGH81592.1 hypothetical protein PCNPT3_08270 [Psychromonas sp. CNPT3]
MSNYQEIQPYLIFEKLFKGQFIHGIYRLAGYLLLQDKKQRPYWKMIFSDVHGSICMYMFNQPSEIEYLGNGVFVELTGEVKTYGKQHYIEIITLKRITLHQITDQIALVNLPANYCPDPNNLMRLYNVLSMIENRSLLHFIAEVIVPMDICIPFLQAPASLNYHHNYAGGLLAHTVEVAEIVSRLPLQTKIEQDLAITGATLHDIGKVKSIDGRMRRLETGKWVDHSALTLEVCANALSTLEKTNSLFTNILRNTWTCASPAARYGYEPKTAVAEAVQMADRFSAKKH